MSASESLKTALHVSTYGMFDVHVIMFHQSIKGINQKMFQPTSELGSQDMHKKSQRSNNMKESQGSEGRDTTAKTEVATSAKYMKTNQTGECRTHEDEEEACKRSCGSKVSTSMKQRQPRN